MTFVCEASPLDEPSPVTHSCSSADRSLQEVQHCCAGHSMCARSAHEEHSTVIKIETLSKGGFP